MVTLEQFAVARPEMAANLAGNELTFDDRIGPWQLVGNQLWFGKTFYNGEGSTGVGGFGYFEAVSRTYQIFSPPEIADYSVSAILVEPDAVWLSMINRGEWGNSGGGVLRYDRQSKTVRKFNTSDLIRQFLRVGDRLVLATNQGVIVIANGQLKRYLVDRTEDGQWRVVDALSNGL